MVSRREHCYYYASLNFQMKESIKEQRKQSRKGNGQTFANRTRRTSEIIMQI